MTRKNKQRGLTMMEILAAIFVVTVGVIGVFSLVSQTISYLNVASSRLVAIYLAQEGIEIVRNIRDTNFLKINQGLLPEDQWADGLIDCEAGCEADYNDLSLNSADRYLKIDSSFYDYELGADSTPFKRKISISLVDLDSPPDGIDDKLEISVEVTWEEKGRMHEVTVQENLYCWY